MVLSSTDIFSALNSIATILKKICQQIYCRDAVLFAVIPSVRLSVRLSQSVTFSVSQKNPPEDS